MSRFFAERNASCLPYVPGEQPHDRRYIKLNTNESPYPPAPAVLKAIAECSETLNLYNDPDFHALREIASAFYGVSKEEITFTNGSDEALNLAFLAFADDKRPLRFPDLTYGFYKIAAAASSLPWKEIPLHDDFTWAEEDYLLSYPAVIVLANPNAPSAINVSQSVIASIADKNPNSVIIVDEAYVDFGGESCIPLIHTHDNIIVIQTFSKSRSLAGARVGLAIGPAALIADINTLRSATVPYNVSTMAQKAAIAAYQNHSYYTNCCSRIMETRDRTKHALRSLGFIVTDSCTNFVFAKHPAIDGETLYRQLKEQGILVRHFSSQRISEYVRITIGLPEEMDAVLLAIQKLLSAN